MRPYEGLLTAMVTPMRPDGAVDEEGAVALGRHLLAHGSDGLVVCGTTGEAATLSDEEQIGLIARMASELGSRGSIVGGAGSNDTRHAAHLTRAVVDAGAHAVLSVTPYYNRPNRRGILRHFEAVCDAAGDTPVILYNIPSRTATNMPPDLLAELAGLGNVVAVKQANADELVPVEGLEVLAGNDENLAAVLDMGGAGGICVSSHVVGDEMKRMFAEPERRADIDAGIRDVYATMFLTASPAPVKAALKLLGLPSGPLRLPMVECDEEETGQVRACLERHGLLSPAAA